MAKNATGANTPMEKTAGPFSEELFKVHMEYIRALIKGLSPHVAAFAETCERIEANLHWYDPTLLVEMKLDPPVWPRG